MRPILYQLTFTMLIQTPEQIQFFSDVCNTFHRVENIENKNMVLGYDTNTFLKLSLKNKEGHLSLKGQLQH